MDVRIHRFVPVEAAGHLPSMTARCNRCLPGELKVQLQVFLMDVLLDNPAVRRSRAVLCRRLPPLCGSRFDFRKE